MPVIVVLGVDIAPALIAAMVEADGEPAGGRRANLQRARASVAR